MIVLINFRLLVLLQPNLISPLASLPAQFVVFSSNEARVFYQSVRSPHSSPSDGSRRRFWRLVSDILYVAVIL